MCVCVYLPNISQTFLQPRSNSMDWKCLWVILVSLDWHLSKETEFSGKFLRVSKDHYTKWGRGGGRQLRRTLSLSEAIREVPMTCHQLLVVNSGTEVNELPCHVWFWVKFSFLLASSSSTWLGSAFTSLYIERSFATLLHFHCLEPPFFISSILCQSNHLKKSEHAILYHIPCLSKELITVVMYRKELCSSFIAVCFNKFKDHWVRPWARVNLHSCTKAGDDLPHYFSYSAAVCLGHLV